MLRAVGCRFVFLLPLSLAGRILQQQFLCARHSMKRPWPQQQLTVNVINVASKEGQANHR